MGNEGPASKEIVAAWDGREFLKGPLLECAELIETITGDPELASIFHEGMRNTLETTLSREADGTTFVITGDIPAMWLRDSSAQMLPFLRFLDSSDGPALYELLAGLSKRQFQYVAQDSYANAFNQEANGASYDPEDCCDDPWVWERKYEVDSLAFPLWLAHTVWRRTTRTDVFDEAVHGVLRTIVNQLRLEQDHEKNSPYSFVRNTDLPSETLQRGGKGPALGITGMTWAGFRPSDDACVYSFNVPGNLFAAQALRQLAEIAAEIYDDGQLASDAASLAAEIAAGVAEFGVIHHPLHGDMYAYEVDGLGNTLLMDDANMPSLLSLPLTGGIDQDDPLYLATRAFILSGENPYCYRGSHAAGIGSPHTPSGYIWPIGMAVQGLTTPEKTEKLRLLQLLRDTTGGTGAMHEGFDVDNPARFTRPWFSWANSMFAELLLDYCDLGN
ncbi:glycoside hydrolase family 125 protein [Arthrobacter glacialis]|uniref:glycoside hydrolase family 125 protein n=1 Tax=Arthrobacter glacialis TaxID=1664 RepID=UPI000CD3E2D3|nr:glycoside hydrolase family 125 protein [Arthrobacter glacialis]POH60948.1 metal-independent alpha-mannosidase [Arthrobacter glacialis]